MQKTTVEQTVMTDFLIGLVNEHCQIKPRILWHGRKRITSHVFEWMQREGYMEPMPGRPDMYQWTAKALGLDR